MTDPRKAKKGDLVWPDPMWNATEQPRNHLHEPTTVLDTGIGGQTGVLLEVQLKGGSRRWLSSGWFTDMQIPRLTSQTAAHQATKEPR